MYVLFQRQQYLIGVHGLDQIVGYLLTDGLVHDVLLLALGHHHHWSLWCQLLDVLQGFQTAESWHHFVQQHQVEGTLPAFLDGISTVGHSYHFIAFFL